MTLPKNKVFMTFLDPYQKEFFNFTKRNYKYIRKAQQSDNGTINTISLVRKYLRKLKETKLVYKVKINWVSTYGVHIKKEGVLAIYKKHGKTLQQADVTIFGKPQHYFFPGYFKELKNVKETVLIDKAEDLELIPILPDGQTLTVHILHSVKNLHTLSKVISRSNNIKTLRLMISSSYIPNSLETFTTLLEQISRKLIELEVCIHLNTEYKHVEDLLNVTGSKIAKLTLMNNLPQNSVTNIFSQSGTLLNLRNLFVETRTIPDIRTLGNIQSFSQLKTLDLSFPFKFDQSFIKTFLATIRLPSTLTGFKLKMPLLLSPMIIKNKAIMDKVLKEGKADDSINLFEEEEIITPLFQALESAKELKYIDFEFAIGELFLSPFTHFFSSMLKRLPKAETVKIHVFEKDVVVGPDNKAEENGENCINLSLFFDCCPDLPNLVIFSLSMPNYYFGYINLLRKFPKLNTFILGTQETLFFEKINNQIERMLKSLNENDIQVLDFEFTETLSSAALLKRFVSFKKFKNLRYLGSRYKISNMKEEVTKEIGISLQGFRNLAFLYLAFENFEKDFKGLGDYIKYHHSIKDFSIIFITSQ